MSLSHDPESPLLLLGDLEIIKDHMFNPLPRLPPHTLTPRYLGDLRLRVTTLRLDMLRRGLTLRRAATLSAVLRRLDMVESVDDLLLLRLPPPGLIEEEVCPARQELGSSKLGSSTGLCKTRTPESRLLYP